jgi:hypothetical protein
MNKHELETETSIESNLVWTIDLESKVQYLLLYCHTWTLSASWSETATTAGRHVRRHAVHDLRPRWRKFGLNHRFRKQSPILAPVLPYLDAICELVEPERRHAVHELRPRRRRGGAFDGGWGRGGGRVGGTVRLWHWRRIALVTKEEDPGGGWGGVGGAGRMWAAWPRQELISSRDLIVTNLNRI